MKTVVALASALVVTLAVSNASARTFTYELRGSHLDKCEYQEFFFDPEPPSSSSIIRDCTPKEQKELALKDGQTFDGRIRVDSSKLDYGTIPGGFVFTTGSSFFPEEDPNRDAFEFDLANIGNSGFFIGGFGLRTDEAGRPVSWGYEDDFQGGGPIDALGFDGPNGQAFFASFIGRNPEVLFLPEDQYYWSGPGGTLSLIPVPAALPLALAGIGALGLAGWRCRSGATG